MGSFSLTPCCLQMYSHRYSGKLLVYNKSDIGGFISRPQYIYLEFTHCIRLYHNQFSSSITTNNSVKVLQNNFTS